MSRHPTRTKTAAVTAVLIAGFLGQRYGLPLIGLAETGPVPVGTIHRLATGADATALIGASIALAGREMTPLGTEAVARLHPAPAAPPTPLAPRPSPAAADALQALPAGATPCLESNCRLPEPAVAADPETTGSIRGADAAAPNEPVRQSRIFSAIDVLDGRSFRADGMTVRLANLVLPPPRRQCQRVDGVSEPCALRARTRLDLITRHRPVACDLDPAASGAGALTGACRVGTADLTLWLIREGWATPVADTPAAAAALGEARRTRAGLWR